MNISVITPPLKENLLLINFLHVLEPLADQLILIAGEYPENQLFSSKIKLVRIKSDYKKQSLLIRSLKFASVQFQMAWYLAKNRRNIDRVIFFLDGGSLVLPMLFARLLKKRPLNVVTHSSSQIARHMKQNHKSGTIRQTLISVSENIDHSLSHRMVVYSPGMVTNMNLQKFREKIIITHEQYIDFNLFKNQITFNDRPITVGFVGRFSDEKGIINFVKALPLVNIKQIDIKYLVAGGGQLKNEIDKYLSDMNLPDQVKVPGFVPHDELSQYLNELKLLVIPSYTEGLPNIMLEAMACGTPVLATPVGSIPDFIKDGKTGFIMENNSPECIAENILRCLNHPGLAQVALNGRGLVEKEFTLERAVEEYRQILA